MKKLDFKGSVVLNPVPAVLVTTRNDEGKENVFTVAWVGTVCTKPPMLSISVRPERLSYEYIKETMEFVVNLPSVDQTEKVDFCGVRSGRQVDKIKEMGFTMIEGTAIKTPYIEECPINIECRVKDIIPLGTHDMVLAEVVSSHVNQSLLDEKGKIHFENANLITYCHGEYFPMSKNVLGSFGYSVMKAKTKEKKRLEEEKKSEENKTREPKNHRKGKFKTLAKNKKDENKFSQDASKDNKENTSTENKKSRRGKFNTLTKKTKEENANTENKKPRRGKFSTLTKNKKDDKDPA